MFTIVKTVYTYKFNDFNIKNKIRVNEKNEYDDYKKMDNINNETKKQILLKKTNFVAFVLRFVS